MTEMTGMVVYAGPIEQRGTKGFKVQQIIIKQDDVEYRGEVPVEFTRDLLKESQYLNTGDRVRIVYELHGRCWETKWFLNAEAKQLTVLQCAEPVVDEPTETKIGPKDDNLPF
jgi:hypothetical protein